MNKKIIAILLASTITFGWLPVSAYAYSSGQQTRIESKVYKTGTYEVNNSIFKTDEDTDSAARKYVDTKSTITINKNDMTASLTFNNKSLMSDIVVKVNGSEIKYTSVEEGATNLKITFNLDSINDNIEVSSLINTGFFKLNVSFRVLFDTSSLPLEEETPKQDGIYKNGTYEVNNSIFKIDADADSAARKYIDTKSTIVVNNDDITASVIFNQKSLMSDIKVKVNGNEISYTTAEEGATNLKVTFALTSLEDNIEISSMINTGFFKMNVSFRVILDTSEIPKNDSSAGSGEETDDENKNYGSSDEQKPVTPQPPAQNPPTQNPPVQNPPQSPVEEPEVPEAPTPDEEKAPAINTPPSSDSVKNYSIYKIKNEILSSSTMGYSAARAAVNSYSYVEKIDGKTYVTLGISQLDVMSNIRVYVNGSKVNYEILRKSDANHTMDIRYSVNSLSDTVNISAYINMMDMDISFGLDLLEDTMTLMSSTSATKPLAQKTESTVLLNTNSSTSSSESTSAQDSETSSETEDLTVEAKSYFKKYTIENSIISDSTIGKNMARKYIDSTSILEDIDGQLYLTLVLSDSSAMSNIKIKVNNEDVKFSKANNNGKVSYKFKIGSITDDIKMSMTITVVNKKVEFGIDLLEDTMKLVEEKTIEQEEKETIVTKVETPVAESTAAAASPANTTKIILISIISTILAIGLIEAIVFAFIKKKKVK